MKRSRAKAASLGSVKISTSEERQQMPCSTEKVPDVHLPLRSDAKNKRMQVMLENSATYSVWTSVEKKTNLKYYVNEDERSPHFVRMWSFKLDQRVKAFLG